MRISPAEKNAFIEVINQFLPPRQTADLRLYGSRMDDNKKGGDFDLLLVLQSPEQAKALNLKLHYLLSEIKNRIGEQRIDLKIIDNSALNKDEFFRDIYQHSDLLKHFN